MKLRSVIQVELHQTILTNATISKVSDQGFHRPLLSKLFGRNFETCDKTNTTGNILIIKKARCYSSNFRTAGNLLFYLQLQGTLVLCRFKRLCQLCNQLSYKL